MNTPAIILDERDFEFIDFLVEEALKNAVKG